MLVLIGDVSHTERLKHHPLDAPAGEVPVAMSGERSVGRSNVGTMRGVTGVQRALRCLFMSSYLQGVKGMQGVKRITVAIGAEQ